MKEEAYLAAAGGIDDDDSTMAVRKVDEMQVGASEGKVPLLCVGQAFSARQSFLGCE